MTKYSRKLTNSATGLTANQCKEALSDEFLELLQEEEKPLYKRFSFSSLFSKTKQ